MQKKKIEAQFLTRFLSFSIFLGRRDFVIEKLKSSDVFVYRWFKFVENLPLFQHVIQHYKLDTQTQEKKTNRMGALGKRERDTGSRNISINNGIIIIYLAFVVVFVRIVCFS
jgi:hypothetical protein